MTLIANGYRLGLNPCKHVGGLTTIYNGSTVRDSYLTGSRRNLTASDDGITTEKAGVAVGYRHPYAWVIPQKAGALSSHNQAVGIGSATLNLADGRNLSGTASGEASATASLELVVSLSGTAVGLATVTGGLVAALAAEGLAAGEAVVTAVIGALAWAYGVASGSSSAGLTPYATGRLEGAITPYTELSPQTLAAAVWSEEVAKYPDAGTTGKALASAGSAGDPWSTILPGSYGAGTAGKLVSDLFEVAETTRGLSHENFILDEQVFDTHDPPRLISARVRLFANATDCESETNPIKTYAITSSYGVGGKFKAVLQ